MALSPESPTRTVFESEKLNLLPQLDLLLRADEVLGVEGGSDLLVRLLGAFVGGGVEEEGEGRPVRLHDLADLAPRRPRLRLAPLRLQV